VTKVANASGSISSLPRNIHHNFLVSNYLAGVGGVDNDDSSQEFQKHHNFLVFGGVKQRGLAEDTYESILAYTNTIGEGENQGWGPSYASGKRGPFSTPKQIRNNTFVLLPGTVAYHTCWGAPGNVFGNQLFGNSSVLVSGTGCCSNCNVTCCTSNCTKQCRAASFTLVEWQQRDSTANDAGTTLDRTTPSPEWIIGQARKLLMGVSVASVSKTDDHDGVVAELQQSSAANMQPNPEGEEWVSVAQTSSCTDIPINGTAAAVFVGERQSAAECQVACAARAGCLSYCYIGASPHIDPTGHDWARRCYARSDSYWQLRKQHDSFAGCDKTRTAARGYSWCASHSGPPPPPPSPPPMTRGNIMHCVQVPPFIWPESTSDGCPLEGSELSLRFTGHGCSATAEFSADTVYMMEGADGELYTMWADGKQGDIAVRCSGPGATTGWAVFNGTTPRDLRLLDHGLVAAPGGVGGELNGRYPCAGASFDGVYYGGTYSEDNGGAVAQAGRTSVCGGNAWCIGGPFVGWQFSTDKGVSWTLPALNSSSNVFRQSWPQPPEPFQFKVQQVRWVDYGRNNQHSPDGAHYLVAHGCNGTSGYGCTWTQGSHLYMLRIKNLSPKTINDLGEWEYWAGGTKWSKDFSDLAPVLAWPNRTGPAAISWLGGEVRKYLLVVGTPTVDTHPGGAAYPFGEMGPTLDTWVAEADTLTGPYRLVQYLKAFGNQAYNPNSPAKFWGDSSTGWLWYSAMWEHLPGTTPLPPYCNVSTRGGVFQSRGTCYGSVSAEVQLVPKRKARKTDDLGTVSLDLNDTTARMPATHAGLIMEGVNHALYGYGLGSQMLFGEGWEEPSITDCIGTAHGAASACYGRFPEQWLLLSGRGALTTTKAEVFTGKQALRVGGSARLLNGGLHRLGIATTQGWSYEGSIFYRYKADPSTAKLASSLTMQLITNEQTPHNATNATVVTLAPTGKTWQRINLTLPAASLSFPNCSLAIDIEGGSVIFLDAVLLEPVAEHRWRGMHVRRDIAEAIAGAGLRFMRFGGDMAESAEPLPYGYTWRNQIGDPQRRPPKLNGAWYAWDSFGFGIFEVLEMAEKMGFGTDRQGSWGLMITLNYRVETPESCALFAEYCFGGADTKGGAMRIANGRSKPYVPFFVEIGNEQHPAGGSIQPYLKVFREQVDAMLAVPSARGKLKYLVGTSILTIYPDDDIRALFDYCRGKPCGYDWHIGIGNHSDIAAQLSGKVDSLQALNQLYERMGTNASEFVTIIGEENCDHWPTIGAHPGCHSPSAYYQSHMWGVALNRALEHAAWSNALQSPLGSTALASNPSSAAGSWYTHMSTELNPNGPKIGALWLSANIQYTPEAAIVQPPMHAQSMIGHSQLPNVLAVQRSSTLPVVNFSIAALASDDRERLTVRVVNLNQTNVTAAIAIAGGSGWSGTVTTLSGQLDDFNSPEQPLHVVPAEAPITAAQLSAGVVFIGHSFAVLNLKRSPAVDEHGVVVIGDASGSAVRKLARPKNDDHEAGRGAVSIGSERHLFVDGHLLASQDKASSIVMHYGTTGSGGSGIV
jgi:alpha-L-arabinofuranosidase